MDRQSDESDVATNGTVITDTALVVSGRNLLPDHRYLRAISQEIPTDSGDKIDPKAPIRLLTFKYTDFNSTVDHPGKGQVEERILKGQKLSKSVRTTNNKGNAMDGENTYEERAIDVSGANDDREIDEEILVIKKEKRDNILTDLATEHAKVGGYDVTVHRQETATNGESLEDALAKLDTDLSTTEAETIFREVLHGEDNPGVVEQTVERSTAKKGDGTVTTTVETFVVKGGTNIQPGQSELAGCEEIDYPFDTTEGNREVTKTCTRRVVTTRTTKIVKVVNGVAQEVEVVNGEPANVQTEHQEILLTNVDQPKSLTITEPKSSKISNSTTVETIKEEVGDTEVPVPYVNGTSPVKSPNSTMASNEISFDHAVTTSHTSEDSGTGSEPPKPAGHFVVVAIDFGTTFSGYSFSFTRDPDNIYMMRKWEAGDPGVVNQKTPTTLLLKPDGAFYSFGFSARDFYHDLDPQEAKKWMYFEKFKMKLHYSQDLNKNSYIEAVNGAKRPAIEVFTHALQFFKEHALQELSDQSSTQILNDDVRWVITVPAIWREPAKQFMREAAYRAGIASPDYPDQLLIALEPEAASIYCRRLRLHQLVPEMPVKKQEPPFIKSSTPEPMNTDRLSDEIAADSSALSGDMENSFDSGGAVIPLPQATETVGSMVNSNGTRYMVVDCGGGTVDITVHEMDTKLGKLKELYKATGGPYGAVGIDLEFEKLLVQIFGQEFMDLFKQKRPAGYVDLMMAFESRKRAATPYRNNPLNVSLPFSFIDYYKKSKARRKGNTVENAIRKYGDKDIKWSSQGMLRLNHEAMRKLFLPTMERINMSIGEVLNRNECKEVRFLFLVGGFAESPMLQANVKREFGHLVRVIIPQDVGLSILKGAVMFGLDPSVVTVRKSRMTYGVGVLNRYIKGKHPKNKLVKKEGMEWCTDVFDKFVSTDQSIALGDTVLRSYTPAKPGQKSSVIHIYSSERSNAKFITDKGVQRCGTLCLDLSNVNYPQNSPKRREIQTRMTFGDTYIKVTALDITTGKSVRAAINFLNK